MTAIRSNWVSLGLRVAVGFLAALFIVLYFSSARADSVGGLPDGAFARVDGVVITAEQYLGELRERARRKFYHGKAPEKEFAAFRREVGEEIIMRALLDREAQRRGIEADEARVQQRLTALERRYEDTAGWDTHRERILAEVGERWRTADRIAALEARVRDMPEPTEAEVRAYYETQGEKFTTPERIDISLILLRVPPSGTPEQWEDARIRIEALAERLGAGADFAALAELYSQDASAEEGGRLGFLHRNILADTAQQLIDGLEPGQTGEPLLLLEGYALFRLNARAPAQLNPFEDVRERARELLLRERREQAWTTLRRELREAAAVEVNDAVYLAATQTATATAAPGQ